MMDDEDVSNVTAPDVKKADTHRKLPGTGKALPLRSSWDRFEQGAGIVATGMDRFWIDREPSKAAFHRVPPRSGAPQSLAVRTQMRPNHLIPES